MSIVLNQDVNGLWSYVIVSPTGALLQTSRRHFLSPEIAASMARMWIDSPHDRD